MDTNYNKLLNNLTDLKLERMKDSLPQYIDMINSGNKTIVDALYELTEKEKSFKKEKAIKALSLIHIQMCIRDSYID